MTRLSSADRGVDSFIKSLRENRWDAHQFVRPGLEHGNVPNVYAEIGSTMQAVFGDPDQAAHLLGKLITYVGPQRVAWGTDSLWFGSPQPIIVALRSFEFSDKAKEFYNLPYGLNGDRFDPTQNALDPNSYLSTHPAYADWPTDRRAHPERTIRNGIFGRNSAVPYRVDPELQRRKIATDDVQKIRDAYLLNPMTPNSMNPGAALKMTAARTPAQLRKKVCERAVDPVTAPMTRRSRMARVVLVSRHWPSLAVVGTGAQAASKTTSYSAPFQRGPISAKSPWNYQSASPAGRSPSAGCTSCRYRGLRQRLAVREAADHPPRESACHSRRRRLHPGGH